VASAGDRSPQSSGSVTGRSVPGSWARNAVTRKHGVRANVRSEGNEACNKELKGVKRTL